MKDTPMDDEVAKAATVSEQVNDAITVNGSPDDFRVATAAKKDVAKLSTVRTEAQALHGWATDDNATGLYAATKELVRIVSEAYLAEHPADSDLPLTEEWLRSVGFEDVGYVGWPVLRSPKSYRGGPVCYIEYEPMLGCDGWFVGYAPELAMITPPSVRGDVRHLARALGIELLPTEER